MECAVKWIYSADSSLAVPWDDNLASLLSTDEFLDSPTVLGTPSVAVATSPPPIL
ncbi:MAG: hypothetical protein Q4F00_03345 [bacterium]|nr:hypothetical protein [bacterium]